MAIVRLTFTREQLEALASGVVDAAQAARFSAALAQIAAERSAAIARDMREWEANEHDLPADERFAR